MAKNTYDIQELSGETGVPRRTIYFYVQQGVLPPPQGAGLAAHYTEDHLLRLKLIPVLRQQGLRLDEIREKFQGMSIDEMRQVAGSAGQLGQGPIRPEAPDLPGPFPGWGEQRYTHFSLPHGITLTVPDNILSGERQRIHLLLQAAGRIFNAPRAKIIHLDSGQPGQTPVKPEEEDSHSA